MTSETTRPPDAIDPSDRSIDVRLARIHLRSGSFGLARTELETLAGSGGLDDEALLDLAEVRWRTGDLTGAGDAARAYLATGRGAALGFVIAAEAAAALGRPGEARRLATLALEGGDLPLEAIFAGLPRSGAWPTDPSDPGEPVGALFPAAEADAGSARRNARAGSGVAAVSAGVTAPGDEAAPLGAGAIGAAAAGPGLWDETAADTAESDDLPGADAELAAARVALGADDVDTAAVHLGLALRLDPSVALAVLEIAGSRSRPALDLVRGDAYRVIGHDDDAARAYRAAAAGLTASLATGARAADATGDSSVITLPEKVDDGDPIETTPIEEEDT